jgi:nicotinamide riboside transporter PnuC
LQNSFGALCPAKSAIGTYDSVSEKISNMPVKGWRKVNTWRIKGPILVVALLLGFFDHALHWGSVSFAVAIAMVLPIIGFRDFWNLWKFWVTVVALAFLQALLVLALRPVLEKSGFVLLYGFSILDCTLVVAVIFRVCCENGSDARRDVGNHSRR